MRAHMFASPLNELFTKTGPPVGGYTDSRQPKGIEMGRRKVRERKARQRREKGLEMMALLIGTHEDRIRAHRWFDTIRKPWLWEVFRSNFGKRYV